MHEHIYLLWNFYYCVIKYYCKWYWLVVFINGRMYFEVLVLIRSFNPHVVYSTGPSSSSTQHTHNLLDTQQWTLQPASVVLCHIGEIWMFSKNNQHMGWVQICFTRPEAPLISTFSLPQLTHTHMHTHSSRWEYTKSWSWILTTASWGCKCTFCTQQWGQSLILYSLTHSLAPRLPSSPSVLLKSALTQGVR